MRRHVSLVIRLCLSGMLLAASAWPQSGGEWIVDTIAGGELGDDSPAVQAQLNSPAGVAADTAGNLYIADTANGRIRRVNARGTITTVAGGGSGGDGGRAVQAQLNSPTGVAVDAAGNLYIADTGNSSVRRVDTRGTITTIAGTGEGGFSGDGGRAVQAQLNGPTGVAVDAAGNLYIADTGNSSIRRVDTRGTITTIAGTGEGGFSGDGGPAFRARLRSPSGVAVDAAGNLYIADTGNSSIRRVDTTGRITTVAHVYDPRGVSAGAAGNIYVAHASNDRILQVSAGGTITTIAGTDNGGYSGDNGPAVQAQLSNPRGVAVDRGGNLYIADTGNHRIRRVAASGTITTIAGTGEGGFRGDGGPALQARLRLPTGMAVDGARNLYIADTYNHRIRKADATGIITTIAGTGDTGYYRGGYGGDTGPAVEAQLNAPHGVTVDGTGNLYIADRGNDRIRRVNTRGTITTIAGGQYEYSPRGVAVDSAGNLYFTNAGFGNHYIRQIDASGTITKIAGVGGYGYSGDGGPAFRARLRSPSGVAVDADGNLYIADTGNNCIRRITSGRITTIAGTGIRGSGGDGGLAVRANLDHPHGVAVDADGNLYIADTGNHRIRRVSTSGTITTIAGTGEAGFSGDGGPAFRARLRFPSGVAVDAAGNLYIADTGNHRIRVLRPSSSPGTRLFVPVILTASGRNNSFFTSELALTNRGKQTATLRYTYTAAAGGGRGRATETLAPGRQKIVSNAIDHLRTLGIPIPGSGNRIGTLRVEVSGSDVGVTVRTTTRVAGGRAGLAYPGIAVADGFTEAVYLCGLRQNTQDRSNVAFQNMGTSQEGSITLRTTVFPGDPFANPRSRVMPDVTLAPGGFHQYSGLLATAGIEQGYVRVERVRGGAPFYAYGVINDQANSDGSFVFPVTRSSLAGVRGLTLPVIIEHSNFSSELILTNLGTNKVINFDFVADAITAGNRTAGFFEILPNGAQKIIPEIVKDLRRRGVAGIGPAGRTLAGALFAEGNDLTDVVIGARTGSAGGGGQYSVFYSAVPYGAAFGETAWVDALQQNRENRSNLALVNTGEVDGSDSVFRLEIYDGGTGRRVNTVTGIRIPARGWRQINGILGNYAPGTTQGYVRVRKTAGNNPFLAYGVVNDGGAPGQRSGDGAYVPAQQ